MYSNFDNAKTRLCKEYKSIRGMAIDPEWWIWFELYRDAFVTRLDKLGITDEGDFVTLLQNMDQYENVGSFLCDVELQQAELAAFGLIVFDRIMRAEKAGVNHAEVFAMHQDLIECYTPEIVDLYKSVQAQKSARVGHEKNMPPKAWVVTSWVSRTDRRQSKAAFARQYATLVKKKFDLIVNPDTIARYWLPKSKN